MPIQHCDRSVQLWRLDEREQCMLHVRSQSPLVSQSCTLSSMSSPCQFTFHSRSCSTDNGHLACEVESFGRSHLGSTVNLCLTLVVYYKSANLGLGQHLLLKLNIIDERHRHNIETSPQTTPYSSYRQNIIRLGHVESDSGVDLPVKCCCSLLFSIRFRSISSFDVDKAH